MIKDVTKRGKITSTTQATPNVYWGKSYMGKVIQVGLSKQAIKW